jgi:hypothetical protein
MSNVKSKPPEPKRKASLFRRGVQAFLVIVFYISSFNSNVQTPTLNPTQFPTLAATDAIISLVVPLLFSLVLVWALTKGYDWVTKPKATKSTN